MSRARVNSPKIEDESYVVRSDQAITELRVESDSDLMRPYFKLLKAIAFNGLLPMMDRGDLRLLVALAAHQTRDNQWSVWPSRETLSDLTGMDPSTVKRARGNLERLGIIKVETRPGTANIYHFQPIKTRSQKVKGQQRPHDDDVPDGTSVIRMSGGASTRPGAPMRHGASTPPGAPASHEGAHERPKRGRTGTPLHKSITEKKDIQGGGVKMLVAEGVSETMAKRLSEKHGPSRIKAVIDEVRRKAGVRNRAGLIVKYLTNNLLLPGESHDKRRLGLDRRIDAETAAQKAERRRQERIDSLVDDWLSDTDPGTVDQVFSEYVDSVEAPFLRQMVEQKRENPSESQTFRSFLAGLVGKEISNE